MEDMEEVVDIQKYLRELYPETPAFCAAQNIGDLHQGIQEGPEKHGVDLSQGFFADAFVLGFISGMARADLEMDDQPDEDFEGVAEVFIHLAQNDWQMDFDALLRLRAANDANFTRGLVNGEKFATTTGGFNKFEGDSDVAQAVKATAVA
jgi:hypothetical protein